MFGCCVPNVSLGKEFSCSVEEIDGGVRVSLTTDDKKRAEALKSLLKAYCELRCDDCCSGGD